MWNVCCFFSETLCRYIYRLGHSQFNGTYVWSQNYKFKSSPYPGQESLQQVIIFGDMGKVIQNIPSILLHLLGYPFLSSTDKYLPWNRTFDYLEQLHVNISALAIACSFFVVYHPDMAEVHIDCTS